MAAPSKDEEARRLSRSTAKADREEGGEDGELYTAMGFVPKSGRSSGLTRRREQTGAKAEGDGMS